MSFNLTGRVHMDFETRSVADIKETGAYKYASDPTTDILCVAYAFGDGEVRLWHPGLPDPEDLIEAARNPKYRFFAFNVGFERRIWRFVLAGKYGWPDTDIDKWQDTQADALAMGFPADLKRCALALDAGEEKDFGGVRLINLLSKPVVKGNNSFRMKKDFRGDFHQMYEYCRQDVRVERSIHHKLTYRATAEGIERRNWALIERMNDRGIPVDSTLATSFMYLIDTELKDQSIENLIDVTEGRVDSGSQIARMKEELDVQLDDMTAGTVKNALKCPLLSDKDRTILEARRVLSKSSTAKYRKIRSMCCDDGTVKDAFQYHAAATGRLGGRGIQPHNFPRVSHKQADKVADFIKDDDTTVALTEEKFGPIHELAKTMLRPTLRTKSNERFVCRDYKSIEAVGTAWSTKDENQLEVFRSGKDIYKATASDMYGLAYEAIEQDGMERQAGKIAVLACGYQGGWKALRDFAIGYGVYWTPKEAWAIVQNFRAARPKLVAAWAEFDRCAMAAIYHPGETYRVDGCEFCEFVFMDGHLWMRLPNGRKLCFPFAEIRFSRIPYETHEGEKKMIERNTVTHMWINNSNQWVRRGIHGGSLFQSYVQAICRDIMSEAMLNLDDEGWPVNVSIHDEIAAVVPLDFHLSVSDFEKTMVKVPDWVEGMPIGVSGWEGRRYRK